MTAIVREILGIDQMKQKQSAPKKNILIGKIENFFDRNDVYRVTTGKLEAVTYNKPKWKRLSTRHNEKPLPFIQRRNS